MRVTVPFGGETLQIDVPDHRVAGVYHAGTGNAGDPGELMAAALANPMNSPGLEKFLKNYRDVAVIVNDATRPTPTAQMLEHLMPFLNGLTMKFIVATGTHRPPKEAELLEIFGPFYKDFRDNDAIVIHDAHVENGLEYLGTSSRGTPAVFNSTAVSADCIITLGSVEPHYFAGFTGGRKSIMPGIASYTTVMLNHRLAMHDAAAPMSLDGNPVNEDILEIVDFFDESRIFSFQVVQDKTGEVCYAAAGNIHSSMDAAVDIAREIYGIRIPRREDIVVTVAPHPMDIDMYQSQKALEHGRIALNPHGTIILVSECRDGIGPMNFYKLITRYKTPFDDINDLWGDYKLGYHKTQKIIELCRYADIYAVTDLKHDLVRKMFMTPFDTLDEALTHAFSNATAESQAIFLMEGSISVPIIEPPGKNSLDS